MQLKAEDGALGNITQVRGSHRVIESLSRVINVHQTLKLQRLQGVHHQAVGDFRADH